MKSIDLSQRIEAHWAWDSFPIVSQAYADGDEFQEFGLRWAGKGFTYCSAPGWQNPGAPTLSDLPISYFAGVASVINLSQSASSGIVVPGDFTSGGYCDLRPIAIIYTGHSDSVPIRRREYWSAAPLLSPALADMLAERGVQHVCLDLSCDSVACRRPDKTGGITNPNEAFRARAHALGLVVTENIKCTSSLQSEVFLFALPLSGEGMTTSPSRPVALSTWASDNPTICDVSTPYVNHWRWRFEMWRKITNEPYDDRTEFLQMGHAYTHCDAPRHMEINGPTIQDLPGMGLDLFLGLSWIIDLSDIALPSPITLELLISRAGKPPPGRRLILRTDLTNRLGYDSTRWHTDAPNLEVAAAEWLVAQAPSAVCIDFPQDFVAREMPGRHVFNQEFVTHHAVLGAGIPFIEDLRDLGDVKCREPFLAAIPLKMTCIDGAPMRAVTLEWT